MIVRAVLVSLGALLALCWAVTASGLTGPTPGEVYRVWLDGRQLNLTASAADDFAPVLSPDGKRVAFVSDRGQLGRRPRERVALYVVDSDGHGLRRVLDALPGRQSYQDQIAWSPDSRWLAVGVATAGGFGAEAGLLVLMRPGPGRPVLVRTAGILSPSWSPDGQRVVFFSAVPPRSQEQPTPNYWADPHHHEIRAITRDGRLAFRLPGISYKWSSAGLLAVGAASPGHMAADTIAVYTERGQLRERFPGRSFAWSPDGTRLASIAADRLELRSLSGRVLLRKRIPGLRHGQQNGLVWSDNRALFIGGIGGPLALGWIRVSAATGKISGRTNWVAFKPYLSPDGRRVYTPTGDRRGIALKVSRPDGSDARILARRRDCPDATEADVQWLPDSRSLIYDFKCQPRQP